MFIEKLFIITAVILISGRVFAKSTIGEAGDYLQFIVPAYAFGMAINEQNWDGAKQFGYSFVAMQASVYTIKSLTHDMRPDKSNNMAFPSGHTAAAFSGAAFIHKRYGWKKAIVPYTMASYVGFSRVYDKNHHIHDVIAGAAIGTGFSWMFTDRIDRKLTLETDGHGAKLNFITIF